METEYHRKTGDANFLFSEFSIGSFFPITLPRFHFNIYVWLHLKHLCVDIYASLVYPTSHLCVVLHFLIFFQSHNNHLKAFDFVFQMSNEDLVDEFSTNMHWYVFIIKYWMNTKKSV